jgi:hypothetical protein
MKQGKNSGRTHRPKQTEDLHTLGCGLVPQGKYNGARIYFQDPWINHYIFNIK